jgi:hypothetical protein
MASDLDQAYVINGDDLRLTLARNWLDLIDTRPADLAKFLLDRIAKPYEARTADVQALARVLRDYAIGIRNPVPDAIIPGTVVGKVVNPEALAETLLEEMDGKAHPLPDAGLVKWNCESCKRGEDGGGWPCDCPVPCGARYCQHPMPQRETPAGIEDRELDAMQAIGDALTGLPAEAQRDILAYWSARADREIAAADPF